MSMQQDLNLISQQAHALGVSTSFYLEYLTYLNSGGGSGGEPAQELTLIQIRDLINGSNPLSPLFDSDGNSVATTNAQIVAAVDSTNQILGTINSNTSSQNADLTNLSFHGIGADETYALFNTWCANNPALRVIHYADYIANDGILTITIRFK